MISIFGAIDYYGNWSATDNATFRELMNQWPKEGLLSNIEGKIRHILFAFSHADSPEFAESLIRQFDEDVKITVADKAGALAANNVDKTLLKRKNVDVLPVDNNFCVWVPDLIFVYNGGKIVTKMLPPQTGSELLNASILDPQGYPKHVRDYWKKSGYSIMPGVFSERVILAPIDGGDILPAGRNVFVGAFTIKNWLNGIEKAAEDSRDEGMIREVNDYFQTFKANKMIELYVAMIETGPYAHLFAGRRPVHVGIGGFRPIVGHIDYVFAPLSDCRVVVSELDEKGLEETKAKVYRGFVGEKFESATRENLDALAKHMEGEGFAVSRIPFIPPLVDEHYSKTRGGGTSTPLVAPANSQFEVFRNGRDEEKRVYMPVTGSPSDDKAKDVFRNLGFQVREIWIGNRARSAGSLHCAVKVLARS